MKNKIMIIVVLIVAFVIGLFVYDVLFKYKSVDIKVTSFDGEVEFLLDTVSSKEVTSNRTRVDSSIIFSVKNIDGFIEKQLNNKYFYKKVELVEENSTFNHYLFLYEGIMFSLSESGEKSLLFTNATASYEFNFDDMYYEGIFPYIIQNEFFYEDNYKGYYSENNLIKNYQTAKEFYSNLNAEVVKFDDENEEIRLKCSNLNTVEISHDDMKVSKGHPIILTFYDEYFEISFDESQW